MGTLKIYKTGSGWEPIGAAPTNLPPGGAANALLAKTSAADGAVGWATSVNVSGVTAATATVSSWVNLLDGVNIYCGIGTGTRIGMAANQKVGFWTAAPVIQNAGWSVTGGYTALKSLDPNTTTLAALARVVGTLVDTLKSYGLLGP